MRKTDKFLFIFYLILTLGGIGLTFHLVKEPAKTQAQQVELACSAGTRAIDQLSTRNPNTGGIRQYACVDNNGNLSLSSASLSSLVLNCSGFAPNLNAANTIAPCLFQGPITVTGIGYQVSQGGTTGAGCTTAPIVNLGGVAGTNITLTNGVTQANVTFNVSFGASPSAIQISQAGSGCGTTWTNVNFDVSYHY